MKIQCLAEPFCPLDFIKTSLNDQRIKRKKIHFINGLVQVGKHPFNDTRPVQTLDLLLKNIYLYVQCCQYVI